MVEILPAIRAHFDALQDRMEVFCQQAVQTEGWLKGELLFLFDTLATKNKLDLFDREVKTELGRIDLYLEIRGVHHFVELKHWHIADQGGVNYGPIFYFADRTVGIVKDVDKLRELTGDAHGWLLLLLTANPGVIAWEAGIEKFNEKFGPRRLLPRSTPGDFPNSYFLGLLEVIT